MVNGVVWFLAIIAGIVLALRFWCKMSRGKGLWVDDYWLIASLGCLILTACFNSASVAFDFGKHGWRINWAEGDWLLLNMNLAGTFSIIAAAWSKTSFAFTLLRIAEARWMRFLVWFFIISLNIALGGGVLITWIQCWPVEKTWRPSTEGSCWPKHIHVHYNIFAAIYSGVMDIVLALMPWWIIWSANMTLKEKLGVMIAMSMGVFAGIISFLKIPSIFGIGKADIIDTVPLVIWGAAESSVTIIAASIPVLRLLLPSYTRHVNELDYKSGSRKLSDIESATDSCAIASPTTARTPYSPGNQYSRGTPYRGQDIPSIQEALQTSSLQGANAGGAGGAYEMREKDLPPLPRYSRM